VTLQTLYETLFNRERQHIQWQLREMSWDTANAHYSETSNNRAESADSNCTTQDKND